MTRWIEVADGVHARRYAELDQTLGLVVGESRALVVDTGMDEAHGAEFAAAIRELTDLPWSIVITHDHFDHFLGTAAFGAAPVYAHPRAVLGRNHSTTTWVRRYRDEGRPDLAERIATARPVPATHLVDDRVELDLGGRRVVVLHPGLGHTDHDLVVHVPDAGVVFAGDLVEQGAPPSAGEDAHPDGWPGALDVVLALRPTTVVPGHGEPVDPAFVAAQRDWISGGGFSAGST